MDSSKISNESLLVFFHKEDSNEGITKATLEKIANRLGVSEVDAINMALAKLNEKLFSVRKIDRDFERNILNDLQEILKSKES